MIRDMNLVRAILEQAEAGTDTRSDLKVDGYNAVLSAHHWNLLQDAGYVKILPGGQPDLTWAGHDLLVDLRAGNPQRPWSVVIPD